MYLRRFRIENLRSIEKMEMEFPAGREAGWHVLLGANGSGKTSVVRAFAVLMMGNESVHASRHDFSGWFRNSLQQVQIDASLAIDPHYDKSAVGLTESEGTLDVDTTLVMWQVSHAGGGINIGHLARSGSAPWGTVSGWFCASFGPFRRFSGGDATYTDIFKSHRRLAPHLSAMGEDVALTEASSWLFRLLVNEVFDNADKGLFHDIVHFLNNTGFFPFEYRIDITGSKTRKQIVVADPSGAFVPVNDLGDGYRSALCLTIEILRQAFELYGADVMGRLLAEHQNTVPVPGIVFIDEIDVHLHPSWQRDIGFWLTRRFPKLQFVVTTHSPIVCRAIVGANDEITGTVWRLPTPGTDEVFRQVEGDELESLAYGDILDAYGTELFGRNVEQSEAGKRRLARLAELNRAALDRELNDIEKQERRHLRAVFVAHATAR